MGPRDGIDPLTAEVAGPGDPLAGPRTPGEPTFTGDPLGGDPLPGEPQTLPPPPPLPPPSSYTPSQPPNIDPAPILPPASQPQLPPPPPPVQPPYASSPPPPPQGRQANYPATLEIEPRDMNRVTTFFRGFLLFPVAVVLHLVATLSVSTIYVARLATFYTRKHPSWLFSAQAGSTAYTTRAMAYALLLTDQFPSFSQEPHTAVQVGFDGERQGTYSRWKGITFRVIACTPHFFVLVILLGIAWFLLTPIGWFAILFTGRYPRGLFNFVEGILRLWVRVTSYVTLLHDQFPPYAMSADASPVKGGGVIASAAGGLVLGGGTLALFIAASIAGSRPTVEEVDYARLLEGDDQVSVSFRPSLAGEDEFIELTLLQAYDPADELLLLIEPSNRQRVVVFEWRVTSRSSGDTTVTGGYARLVYEAENENGDLEESTQYAVLFIADNQANGVILPEDERTTALAAFVIPADAEPVHLYYQGGFANTKAVRYDFE